MSDPHPKDTPMPMNDELAGLPVAWRWEGRDSAGYWEVRLTSYCPHLADDDDYCRKVEPLYRARATARNEGSQP